ncbi:cytochrome [Streptomyces sp. CC53]|uniref:cytochrome P450 n=1 Tax=unclassified Streptomyces TaxID=2593676 RepID=UPI0008DE90EF|nr:MULTISPECIES: cytochrome P450 [unclassified Streptomyces]OII60411.1 cytochrome [Streptomyces sp. CC53]
MTEAEAEPRSASARDAARFGAVVLAPALAAGLLLRRRTGMALAERYAADRRAVRLLGELRRRYGPGPLRIDLAGRRFAVLLDAADAEAVLAGTPDPYAPSGVENRASLERFQPHGALVVRGDERAARRLLDETALETGNQLHSLAPRMLRAVREEAGLLLAAVSAGTGELRWDRFSEAWQATVRRLALGDTARDDTALTAMLGRLRASADRPAASPGRARLRDRFDRRLRDHVERAEPGSLAAALAATTAAPGTDPVGQVPHWLSGFDAAGIAAYRALALLATHASQATQVRNELAVTDLTEPRPLPYTRACVLESVRLWPTTPFLLREAVRETAWGEGTLPAGTEFLIYTPLFQRGSLPYADRFTPEIWLDGTAEDTAGLYPFSAGPGACPGEDVALFATSTLLAALLERHTYLPDRPGRLRPDRPLPRTLDHFGLRFAVLPH